MDISKKSLSEGNSLFPIFLKIDQIRTLLVGGGNVGLEKLEALLKNDPHAKVKIVALETKKEVKELAKMNPNIQLFNRAFQQEDLEEIDLVILATANMPLNHEIRNLARERRLLINVADKPELCDFYLGSTVKKGNLKVGISTNGQSPTFAKRFREMLETSLSDDIDDLLGNLKNLRDSLRGDFNFKVQRLNQITRDLVRRQ
ncbi:precorrin-2 dehydrogenase/sirohydrochlorin ferrochelatase family protein [Xanthovirga aplysinae]|uniref:precorrin-2 dehydrogenase/sirohydrochlorin ferrochelatase family protein n=1 Tax=Xanthovirga aplysinae TaxID=2529853 RepID=UPI0012BBE175|nr:bifunctional precorrin-2 dehydrogenase/sirohydrochlorin ferrochelatase [Xanthovirga aplysinae]MTI31364.1 bifunctional precorrin-2 dehydrogenase/sirohydrochlorin ferrochelatase [Xanthovirga aplysinae]